MILSSKTLESLRNMINEKTTHRTGPNLVAFFNHLGFREQYPYGQGGFPSRWAYTDEKLSMINGTPELEKCIKMTFSPSEFIGRVNELKACVDEFNDYLAFDGWRVEVKNTGVEIHKTTGPDIEKRLKEVDNTGNGSITELDFLKVEIEDIDIWQIGVEDTLKPVLEARMKEMKACFKAESFLSVIFMAGSMLEGILLSVAKQNPRLFNQSECAPKDKDGKAKMFHEWSLRDFITVAHDVGVIKQDVAKFSHVLRDFRNYIHPYQQISEKFYPDENTAKICMQVMKGALAQISSYNFR